MPADSSSDTELARRATGGDGEAFGLLFDRWLDRAFDVAWHVLHNREAAADATQEAFAAAWQQVGSLRQPESFGGWLLRITRNKALNHLQKQRRSSPVGSGETVAMMDPREADDPSLPLDQQEAGDLVWAASAALGEADASLLSLHLRHHLDTPELAEELGVQPNAAHQRLFRLKKRLADAIGAWVLWRKGTPACPDLEAALEHAAATRFDGATAKVVLAHARRCDACDSSRKLQLSPEALFATIPLVAAGPVLRARMVAALDGQGVPIHADPATTGQDATGQATTQSQPSDPSQPSGTEPPSGTDQTGGGEPHELGETNDLGRPQRRRAAAKAGVVAVLVLLGGGGVLAVLADRAGDGTIEATSQNVATGTDTAERWRTSGAGDGHGEAVGTEPGSSGRPTEPEQVAPPGSADPPPTVTPEVATTVPGTTASSGTTGQPAVPRPVILRFVASSADRPCSSTVSDMIEVTFSWETTETTSATLSPDGGQSEAVAPSGSVTRCARPSSNWTLTATGPGGTDSAQVAAPAGPRPQPSGPDGIITP